MITVRNSEESIKLLKITQASDLRGQTGKKSGNARYNHNEQEENCTPLTES
jgi:hypothetical protein